MVPFLIALASLAVMLQATSFQSFVSISVGERVVTGGGAVKEIQLPDSYFVKEECARLAQRAQGKTQLVSEVKRLCRDFQAEKIDEEKWLAGINSLEEKLPGPSVQFGLVATSYKAYCMFLVPSDDWKHRSEDLTQLRQKFLDFGDQIGDETAAVWFLAAESIHKREQLSVDVKRSKDYCDRFHLSYSEGPFVLVMRRRPDLLKPGDEILVIKLHDIDASGVISILNILEEDLRAERSLRRRTLVFEEVKQRIMTAASRHAEGLQAFVSALLKL